MRTILLLALLPACTPALPYVQDADRAYARETFAEMTEDLGQSRLLYVQKCGGCHDLVLPQNVPQTEWPRIVDVMALKMTLPDEEKAKILRYVLTMSRRL